MDLDPFTAWIRIGKHNLLTELHEPIMDYVPDLPDNIISPKPVDPKSEHWFLADEGDSWISL